jgi:hypothetical protein
MWWDVAPDVKAEFEHWHSHEHFAERLSIPGFRRGTRWTSAAGGPGIFVLYELDAHETLSSPAYAARLNSPTPWSTKMMPHHRHMVRSQCRVLESHGTATARHALTIRFADESARETGVRSHFNSLVAASAPPGIVGAHLLRHQPPALTVTTEQKIRVAPDQAADWVFVVCAYDFSALQDLVTAGRGDSVSDAGVARGRVHGLYSLSHSATAEDVI